MFPRRLKKLSNQTLILLKFTLLKMLQRLFKFNKPFRTPRILTNKRLQLARLVNPFKLLIHLFRRNTRVKNEHTINHILESFNRISRSFKSRNNPIKILLTIDVIFTDIIFPIIVLLISCIIRVSFLKCHSKQNYNKIPTQHQQNEP